MEYHSDRFQDFSLMVFKNEKLIAVLPANRIENKLFSHQGLSYGGLVVLKEIRTLEYLKVFKALLNCLKTEGIIEVSIKQLPFIYNKYLTEEFEYLLHELNYKVVVNNSYYVLDDLAHYKPNRNRLRGIKKAESNMKFLQTGLDVFWEHILTKNLKVKFGVKPIHSFKEINLLKSLFPNEIKFYAAANTNGIQAGVVLFITDNVVHFQYSSGKEDRNETGALDFLFNAIIKKYSHYKFISFGSSSTDNSYKIDKGLAYWKESFGAYLIPQRTYNINTNSEINLENIIK